MRLLGKRQLCWLWAAACLISMTARTGDASLERLLPKQNPDTPWEISADQVAYDQKTGEYVARGHVSVSKDETGVVADFVRFNQPRMTILARGHVILTAGHDYLVADQVEMDLNAQTGTIRDGEIFLSENHFYIRGATIKKLSKDQYIAYQASFSACDGPVPDWKITAKVLKVTPEEYGVIRHGALWVKKIPVFYTPFFFFPVKEKRQTGLLTPQFGSSDRKGLEYTQPFFWAIDPSSDATVYLHHMGKRGQKLGVEYRYLFGKDSRGTMRYDYLDDRKIDDGTGDASSRWGYTDDAYLRTNSSRYWFRMKHNQALVAGAEARLDLDIVSDQDYLLEFKDGYSGFQKTRKQFNQVYGRELDDYNDPVRVNRLHLYRPLAHHSLNAEFRWYDDVRKRRWESRDDSLHQMPMVRFDSVKQPLAGPFYYSLTSEYRYFFRENGTKGHRADIHPRLTIPWRYEHYFFLEPSVGLRETVWHVDAYDPPAPEKGRKVHRQLYDIGLDLSTDLFRVYQTPKNGWFDSEAIRHTVRPRLRYEYVPQTEQNNLPYFDALDAVEKKNRITYSLTNYFTAKYRKPADNTDKSGEKAAYAYRRLGRIKLVQSYDIEKARSDGEKNGSESREKRPFSPIYGEMEFTPHPYITLEADAEWDPYEGDFLSRNAGLSVRNGRGDYAFVEHRYTKELSESLYTDIHIRITDALSTYLNYERNLSDDEEIQAGMGLSYAAACWSVDLSHYREYEEKKYSFMVHLSGLGGLSVGR